METHDLHMAAYLVSKGERLADVRVEKRRGFFTFEDGPYVEKLIDEYRSGSALVDPGHYMTNVRRITELVKTRAQKESTYGEDNVGSRVERTSEES